MMNFDHTYLYRMPTKIYYGFGSTASLAPELKYWNASKVLLVADPGIDAAGLLTDIRSTLQEAAIPVVEFLDVHVDPDAAVVNNGVAVFKKHGCDFIIAVGGGSPICAAKGIAVVAANGGDIRDYKGTERFSVPPVPLICVPTTAGSGSEVSAATVLHDEDNDNVSFTMNGFHLFPKAAILDPLLLRGLPAKPFLYAGLDALTHAVESLYTTEATPITDALALYCIKMMVDNMPQAAYSDDLTAIGQQQLASVMCNMACGNAKLGLVHGMGSPAGALYHMTHGLTLGILLPHVMEYNLPVATEKFALLSDMCGWSQPGMDRAKKAEAAVDGIKRFLDLIEFPESFAAEGIPESAIPRMIEIAMTRPQSVVFNLRKPNKDDMQKIYAKAFCGRW